MKAPKVILKKIQNFQGHDGTGLNADIWINGINCMHVFDGAYGGEFEYTDNTYNNSKAEQVKANIKLMDNYINTLPEHTSEFGDKTFKFKVNRDIFINDLLIEQERIKTQKKMQKQMQTCILIGIPDADRYSYFNLKRSLSALNRQQLQSYVANIKIKHCTNNTVILNTNLKELGITY